MGTACGRRLLKGDGSLTRERRANGDVDRGRDSRSSMPVNIIYARASDNSVRDQKIRLRESAREPASGSN